MDFTQPVALTVSTKTGLTHTYTVTVTQSPAPKNPVYDLEIADGSGPESTYTGGGGSTGGTSDPGVSGPTYYTLNYSGNGNSAGVPPVDATQYSPGASAILKDISSSLKGPTMVAGIVNSLAGTSDAVGAGNSNTTAIIAQGGHSASAAKICADFSVTINGTLYDDWYLPSQIEMGNINLTLIPLGLGSFLWDYWTSTEIDGTQAVYYFFPGGTAVGLLKNDSPGDDPNDKYNSGHTKQVRRIRSFN